MQSVALPSLAPGISWWLTMQNLNTTSTRRANAIAFDVRVKPDVILKGWKGKINHAG